MVVCWFFTVGRPIKPEQTEEGDRSCGSKSGYLVGIESFRHFASATYRSSIGGTSVLYGRISSSENDWRRDKNSYFVSTCRDDFSKGHDQWGSSQQRRARAKKDNNKYRYRIK